MRNLFLIFSGIFLSSCVLFSCQIEKRVHRPGYHVQYKKSNTSRSAKVEQSKESKRAKDAQMHAFLESDELSASANDEVIISTKKNETSLVKPFSEVEQNEVFKSDIVKIDTDCETLVYTNGVETKVKIQEITPVFIKYTRCDVENGPLISVNRSDVYKVIYANGVEDIITQEGTRRPNTNSESDEAKLESFGLISFVAAIIGFFVAGIILGPTAIIFGIVSVGLSSSDEREYKGKAFGVIGLLLGVLVTMIMLLYFASL
jgi:hypothetical protein